MLKVLKNKVLELNYNLNIRKRFAKLYFNCLSGYLCGKLSEYKEEIHFIGRHGISMFPYSFTLKYSGFKCEIVFDNDEDKFYVVHNGKRLYFPKGFSREETRRTYKQLVMEQERESPHCYWSGLNKPQEGDIFIDVGAAEGIIALDWIDVVDRVVLIEYQDTWTEALEATFAPYKDKVEILSVYCCEKEGEDRNTIDNIVKDMNNLVIKMDIEGAEINALKGARKTLKRKDVKWAVCVYHRKTDAKFIERIMSKFGKRIEYSDGYLLLPYDLKQEYPYFRKGVLRAR